MQPHVLWPDALGRHTALSDELIQKACGDREPLSGLGYRQQLPGLGRIRRPIFATEGLGQERPLERREGGKKSARLAGGQFGNPRRLGHEISQGELRSGHWSGLAGSAQYRGPVLPSTVRDLSAVIPRSDFARQSVLREMPLAVASAAICLAPTGPSRRM